MNLKLVVAGCVLAATPAFAQGSKPTSADAQKVVQIISADKEKTALYCDIAKLEEQIAQADEKKDRKKLDSLIKQSEAMSQKLGPEYVSLMTGLAQIDDPSSPEGKDLAPALEALEQLCGKK